ncbi:MAG: hypothetical protein EXS48_03515 [Candidatus Staskawiczbacteria bacterium]|nr:hypothetical protein [Candidatus Staskawiczbacteria bacterium]
MFKNIIKKLLIGTLALSIMFVGVAWVPGSAQAKGNDDSHTSFQMNGKILGQNNNSIKEIIKPAQKTLEQAVRDAKEDYKDAQKTAHTDLRASVDENTSKADRITAVKAYFSKILVVLKAKNTAIENAFQSFINTNFNI